MHSRILICIGVPVLVIASSGALARGRGSSLYKEEVYDPDAPAYPKTYSDADKAAQREAGMRFIRELNAAAKEKRPDYKLAPGTYRLRDLPNYAAVIKLEKLDTFTLDLAGYEIIFEEDRGRFSFPKRVKNLSILGPVIFDADQLHHTQGRIIANDPKTFRTRVEIMPGYRVGFRPHTMRNVKKGQTPPKHKWGVVYAYSPQGKWLHNSSWSTYIDEKVIDEKRRIVEFTVGKDSEVYESLYAVGNLVAIDLRGKVLIDAAHVENFTLKDVEIYTGGGVLCGPNHGDWNLIRVRGRRRPGTNRLIGSGGIQVTNCRGRTVLDSCEFSHTLDDILDYQAGSLGMVWDRVDKRTLVLLK